ncbi:MAG: hypothetical protein R6X33_18765 [Candidatus Brocadiia bacterium]
MTNRSGDWKDLLSIYHRALKGNKVWVGFLTALYVFFILVLGAVLYAQFADWGWLGPGVNAASDSLVRLGEIGERVGSDTDKGSLIFHVIRGEGLQQIPILARLLNPLYRANLGHFIVSVLVYIALFWAVSGSGGVISRLTALEYARDDFPTLADARQVVRSKRLDYFLSFLWPALFVLVPIIFMLLIGLFGSIPVLGRIALVPLYVVAGLLGVVAWMFAIGWGLSFGLMMPAVSVGGKDAFDGWSTSYAYVLWQFGRFVCYTLIFGVIGVVSVAAAFWLVELLIYFMVQGIKLGFLARTPWLQYEFGGQIVGPAGGLASVVGFILMVLTLALRILPLAYLVSYFFTGETIVFFLLRKHVDNIDIEEIYEEMEEEESVLEEEPEPEVEPAVEPAAEQAEPEEPEAAEEAEADEAVAAAAEEALEEEEAHEEPAAEEEPAEKEPVEEAEPEEQEEAEEDEEQ